MIGDRQLTIILELLQKERLLMETGPIFIGGLAYSGKTMLRLLLSAHPDILLTRRTYMWSKFYNHYGDLEQPDNFERCLAAMLQQKAIQKLEPDPDRIRREYWQGPTTYAHLFALFSQHYAEKLGKSRWGDQLDGIERYADLIFSAYPGAKIIHMMRDPRSRYQAAKAHFRNRQGKIGWDTARWLHSASLSVRNYTRYPACYKVIRYETLTTRPQETLFQICDFLGVAFAPELVTTACAISLGEGAHRSIEPQAEQNGDSQTKDRIYAQLSRYEVAFTQSFAGRDMNTFDYSLQPVKFSLGERLRFYSVDWPINLLGMVVWRILKARQFTEI